MKTKRIEEAVLTGYSKDEEIVFEQVVNLHEYWDDSHPVIDEDRFRKRKRIRRLVGKLWGTEGQLLQEFVNTFDEEGRLRSSWARHEDGTETNFPPR